MVQPFIGKINPGDSAQFTFSKQVEYNTVGMADIRASIANKPKYGPYGVNVNPSPVGSEITKGAPFQGQFLTGNANDPDVVANPDEINYEFADSMLDKRRQRTARCAPLLLASCHSTD